jgi:hypothetical protein
MSRSHCYAPAMLSLTDYSYLSANQLKERITGAVAGCKTAEAAAQSVAKTICDAFGDEVPLARVYATVPFAQLPPDVAGFVRGAAEGSTAGTLGDETPVLALLGTYGDMPAWRDRRQSKGHAGIPLLSADFVHDVPMIASLLQQLGVDMRLPPEDGIAALCKNTSSYYGSFYVEDARSAVDSKGRKVIPAQDFVKKHGVVSVLGSGAAHLSTGRLLVLILFARGHVSEGTVSRIAPVASRVVAGISKLLGPELLFETR